MQAFVVSDNEALSARVRERLVRSGHECPDSHVVPLNYGTKCLDVADVVVTVMSPNAENSLTVLKEMSHVARSGTERKFLLAVGPPDARLILRTIQLADEYINEEDVDQDLESALVKIMAEGGTRDEPGRVISVLAPSGGSGSSVICSNLAIMLAREHKSCCLFDLKMGFGVMDALLDVKPTHTLADLCRNAERMDRGMFERLLVKHSSGVYLMAAPTSFEDINYVTGQGVRQALTMAKGLYPYIVIDLDRTFAEEQVEAARLSDLILLVLRLDFTSLRNARQTLDHLEQLGVDRSQCRLIFNRHGQPREVRLGQAEEALGMKGLKAIADDPKTINRAINNGLPVVLDQPRMPVARSMMELAAEVHQIMSKPPAKR
jgi:pilus assembly protein CpaE